MRLKAHAIHLLTAGALGVALATSAFVPTTAQAATFALIEDAALAGCINGALKRDAATPITEADVATFPDRLSC